MEVEEASMAPLEDSAPSEKPAQAQMEAIAPLKDLPLPVEKFEELTQAQPAAVALLEAPPALEKFEEQTQAQPAAVVKPAAPLEPPPALGKFEEPTQAQVASLEDSAPLALKKFEEPTQAQVQQKPVSTGEKGDNLEPGPTLVKPAFSATNANAATQPEKPFSVLDNEDRQKSSRHWIELCFNCSVNGAYPTF